MTTLCVQKCTISFKFDNFPQVPTFPEKELIQFPIFYKIIHGKNFVKLLTRKGQAWEKKLNKRSTCRFLKKHSDIHDYPTRHVNDFNLTDKMKSFSNHAIQSYGPIPWNSLSKTIKQSKSVKQFHSQNVGVEYIFCWLELQGMLVVLPIKNHKIFLS